MQPRIEHVVVATDFSASGRAAVLYAARLVQALNGRLHLVHVLEQPFATSGPYEFHLPDTADRRERRYQRAHKALMREAAVAVADARRVTVEVRSGPVTESIAQAGVDYGADLIVLGTRGRAGLRHLLAGDLAERLLRIGRCPVLAVRDRDDARAGLEAFEHPQVA
jgi:nucleotide-binding universal stress UspA family protein